jgi:hypothetical protein
MTGWKRPVWKISRNAKLLMPAKLCKKSRKKKGLLTSKFAIRHEPNKKNNVQWNILVVQMRFVSKQHSRLTTSRGVLTCPGRSVTQTPAQHRAV